MPMRSSLLSALFLAGCKASGDEPTDAVDADPDADTDAECRVATMTETHFEWSLEDEDLYWSQSEVVKNAYDSGGNLQTSETYDDDGELSSRDVYTYGADGKLLEVL